MYSSTLHPPNAHTLSDKVIGGVVQRFRPPRTAVEMYNGDRGSTERSRTATSDGVKSQRPRQRRGSTMVDPGAASTLDKHNSPPNPVPINPLTQLIQTTAQFVIAEETESRRQRGRISMQKYRKKINDRATNLGHDIIQLREETDKLQLQHQTVSARVPTNTTSLMVVAEYFRLFRNGLKTFVPVRIIEQTTSVCNAQRDFLYAAMTTDVVGETGFGVERLTEDYRRLALCFPDTDTQLVHLMVPGDRIIATTTVRITITESTIQSVFPQQHTEREKRSTIAAKLLNQRFVMRGSIHFKWDSMTHRMSIVQSRADLLTPMLQVLGDLETVACLFEEARVTPECKPIY